MLKSLVPTLLLGSAVLAVSLAPRAASAGGVIIDGRVDDSILPGADAEDDVGTATRTAKGTRPLTEDEQEIYLYAAMVFGGHDAATSKLTTSGSTGDNTTNEIIGALEEADVQGGCAATPASGLAALAVFGLLRRRRRR